MRNGRDQPAYWAGGAALCDADVAIGGDYIAYSGVVREGKGEMTLADRIVIALQASMTGFRRLRGSNGLLGRDAMGL